MIFNWHLVLGWLVELALLTTALSWLARRVGGRALLALTLASFALRAVIGQVLYFISALGLPLLRSSQAYSGFWSFAPDAYGYQVEALKARDGLFAGLSGMARVSVDYLFKPSAILRDDPFTWVLGIIYKIFGASPSQGLLLNAALAAACLPLVWLTAKYSGIGRRPALAAVVIVAFWPSSLLWSGQLLKDSLSWLALFAITTGAAFLLSAMQQDRLPGPARLVSATVLVAAGGIVTAGLRGQYVSPIWLVAAVCGVALVALYRVYKRDTRPPWTILRAGVPAALLVLALAAGSAGSLSPLGVSAQSAASGHLSFPIPTKPVPKLASPPASPAPLSVSLSQGARASGPASPPASPAPSSVSPSQGARASGPVLPSTPVAVAPAAPSQPTTLRSPCKLAAPLISGRVGFINSGGNLADRSIPRSCLQVLADVPQAIAFTFLQPSVDKWLRPGATTGRMAELSVADALLLWFLLPGIVAGVIEAIRRPAGANVMIVAYALGLAFVLGFVVLNIGTLFRLRLQVLLPLTLLSMQGWYLIAGSLRTGWLTIRGRQLPQAEAR